MLLMILRLPQHCHCPLQTQKFSVNTFSSLENVRNRYTESVKKKKIKSVEFFMIALFCQNGQKRAKNTLFLPLFKRCRIGTNPPSGKFPHFFSRRLSYSRYLPAVKLLLINSHSLSDRGSRKASKNQTKNIQFSIH